jgi:Protein kinase domain
MAQQWDVPGYTEVKALGSGGFGDVVLARHDASGTLVAIKYLRPELLTDPEFAAMFRGEAEVLASVEDPNVVRLYEYVQSPAGAAIVMELIDGVSLREILARQGKTSAEAALVVLQGSLLGLAAAHQRGVVHRDYKPENVLVNGQGASKLTDFGIAARAGDSPIPAGTLAYAPPEQFGGGPASPSGDVYAATATFYECLTGHPPFGGDSAERLLYQHLAEPVPLDPVPEPLRPLIEAGMAKDPGRRPADATALVGQLRTVASGAYGPDWEDRGRSLLGEAALLLAALWPSGAPAAVQGSTVHRIRLRRHLRIRLRRHLRLRHISPVKAAVAAGVAVVVVAAGTALAAAVSHRSTSPAAPTPATAPKLPVLYNFGGADAAVWNLPSIRPGGFPIFADGSAAVTGMHWAHWNGITAVTSSATYYDRSGPCCTKADQHYYKVTVTLSDVRYSGGPRPGPYFTRMVITGRGFPTLTYRYGVFRGGGVVVGGWLGGLTPPATQAPTSAAAPTPALPPRQQAAQALAALLAQSGTDRAAITQAFSAVASCSPDLSQDETIFSNAASARQALLGQLAALPDRSALPASMLQDLTAAWQASAQADQDFANWTQDEISHGCSTNYQSDASYQAAMVPDDQATADKKAFAALWTAIADEYGLPVYQYNQI